MNAMVEDLGLSFPVAYGIDETDFKSLGAWWTKDHHGRYMQPTEFLISRGGVVFGSLYASGPIGRMAIDEVLYAITARERTRSS